MSETPRHRRPERRRGLRVWTREGRRRRSGAIEESARSARELSREAQLAAVRRARRQVLAAVVVAAGLIGASVAASVWFFGRGDEVASPPTVAAEERIVAALAMLDADGDVASVVVLAADPSGSRVVLFPPGLITLMPGFGEHPLRRLARFATADTDDLLAVTLMNLLGVTVDDAVVIEAVAVGEALGDRMLEVDLAEPLLVDEGATQVVVAGEGSAPRTADQVVRLLADKGVGDELSWLVRQSAAWAALLDAAKADAALLAALDAAVGDGTVGRALAAVAGGDRQIVALPVERIQGAGGDTELYQIDIERVVAFVDTHLAAARIRPEPRPRVEVLNGNGRVGTTRPVAEVLIRHGFRIVRTDNADRTDYETTLIVAHGRQNQQVAVEAQGILGVGEVLLEVRQPSGVVDLSIIVGADIPGQEER